MTKRELINALEACNLPDDAKVKIWDIEKDAHESDGQSPSNALYDFEVDTLNDNLSEDEKQEIRDEHEFEPIPFIVLVFDNPEYCEYE